MFSKAGKKTWQEELEDVKNLPRIVEIGGKKSRSWGKGKMVIPSPLIVDELMRRLPYGKLTTTNQIREILTKKHQVDMTCPLVNWVFLNITANASKRSFFARKERNHTLVENS